MGSLQYAPWPLVLGSSVCYACMSVSSLLSIRWLPELYPPLRTKYYLSNSASLVLRPKSIQFKTHLMKVTFLVFFFYWKSVCIFICFLLILSFFLFMFYFSTICLLLLTSFEDDFMFYFCINRHWSWHICAVSLREFASQEPGFISSYLFLSYLPVIFKGAMNFNKFLAVLLRCNYRS